MNKQYTVDIFFFTVYFLNDLTFQAKTPQSELLEKCNYTKV